MDKDRAEAIRLLDKHFGLGREIAHQKIRTDAGTNAIYNCALEALAKTIEALRPFAQSVRDIENRYGKDLPDHQFQFPEITMHQLRRTKDVFTFVDDEVTNDKV